MDKETEKYLEVKARVNRAHDRLKPCPFCGNKRPQLYDANLKWIKCGCGAYGPGDNRTREEAVAAWNQRIAEDFCFVCKAEKLQPHWGGCPRFREGTHSPLPPKRPDPDSPGA